MSFRFFIFCLLIVCSLNARANFALDPERKDDPQFAKFFLGRTDAWLRKNIYDYRPRLRTEDREFIDSVLADPRGFGEMKGRIFLQTYSFNLSFDGTKSGFGPFRFLRPSPSADDELKFKKVLAAHGLRVPDAKLIGFGFTVDSDEIELITIDKSPSNDPIETFTLYHQARVVKSTSAHPAEASAFRCPAVTVAALLEKVDDSVSGSWWLVRPTVFEDQALSMNGRRLIHQIELGLQLVPGEILYKTQTNYVLSYP